MLRKCMLTLVVFAFVGACVLGAGFALEPESEFHVISSDSACPVVGCASGECHGYGNVPAPDGVSEMTCPEAGCASVECHAWDTLQGRYKRASDASMNIWILAPVILVVGLVVLVGVLSKPKAAGDGEDARVREDLEKGGVER